MSLDKLLNRQRLKNPNKITMKTILPGKLTYVGLAISLAGMVAGRFEGYGEVCAVGTPAIDIDSADCES